MLVSLADILSDTRARGYAVGQFNCVDLEAALGVIQAAEELRSPVIIGPAERVLKAAPLECYADMLIGIAKRATVPVTVHLDHAYTAEVIRRAVDLGFSSVMYDQSMLSFEENAARVREMAEYAHKKGCSVEGEIGHVGSNGSGEAEKSGSVYTDPADALLFAGESRCDALAVAIGTAHGVYREKPVLSFEILSKIAEKCEIPLVLHGGTGLSDEDFRECVRRGISKINIFTAVNLAAARAGNACFTKKTGALELMPFIEAAVKEETMRLMRVFGSDGKA